MTYFGFLALFLVVPIVVLALLTRRDNRRGLALPAAWRCVSPWRAIMGLVIVALVYTTPWDNYLVATKVWWYNPDLVTGITLGWVPLEEYIFFVLQTVMTGLFVLYLARRLPLSAPAAPLRQGARAVAAAIVGLIWLGSAMMLLAQWQPGAYLGLTLAWALPPVMLQLGFGADVLWRYRRVVVPGIAAPALYLSAADVLALSGGTWTINPDVSLGLSLGGILPVEEIVFFLLTNTLITLGVTLTVAQESAARIPDPIKRLGAFLAKASAYES